MKTHLVRVLDAKTGETQPITIKPLGADAYRVTIGGESHEVDGFPTERGISFRMNGRSYDLPVHRDGDSLAVRHPSGTQRFELVDERIHKLRSSLGVGAGALKPELPSPMTGKVVLVRCEPGETVKEGATLVIIEAMKMENEIKAPGDVTVKDVRVTAGDLVAPGNVLVTFHLD